MIEGSSALVVGSAPSLNRRLLTTTLLPIFAVNRVLHFVEGLHDRCTIVAGDPLLAQDSKWLMSLVSWKGRLILSRPLFDLLDNQLQASSIDFWPQGVPNNADSDFDSKSFNVVFDMAVPAAIAEGFRHILVNGTSLISGYGMAKHPDYAPGLEPEPKLFVHDSISAEKWRLESEIKASILADQLRAHGGRLEIVD